MRVRACLDRQTRVTASRKTGNARSAANCMVFDDKGAVVEVGPPDQLLDAPVHERTRRFLSYLHT